MDNPIPALGGSVGRLNQLCRGFDDAKLETQSYCRDWVVADVLSHLGSGAIIMNRHLEDSLTGTETPDDFAPAVWAEWNAKSARDKANDALASDEALLQALEAVSEEHRATLTFSMGPLTLQFEQFAAMRVNEHAFHTWDIEVAFDDKAQLPRDVVAIVIDNLELIARFTARPTGESCVIGVRTTDPQRQFSLRLSPGAAELAAGPSDNDPDLVLPAEAFCRLTYGRLDPSHTPSFTGSEAALDTFRAVFPGP